MSKREACEVLLTDSIAAYNAKQRRKDRHKTVDSYMEEVEADTRGRTNKAIAAANQRAKEQGRLQDVRKDKGKHVNYEVVFSLGSVADRVPEDVAKKIYQQYAEEWTTRNPNFYLYRVDYHDGEYFRSKNGQDITSIGGPPGKWSKGVPHPHFAFIPYADGAFKQGMDRQISTGKALAAMGCNGWEAWEERERGRIAEIAAQYGYTIVKAKDKDPERQHDTQLTTPEFQQLQDQRQELQEQKAAAEAEAKKTIEQAEAKAGVITGQAHIKAVQISGEAADWAKAHKQAAQAHVKAIEDTAKAQAEQQAAALLKARQEALRAAQEHLQACERFRLDAGERERLRELQEAQRMAEEQAKADEARKAAEVAKATTAAGNVRRDGRNGPGLSLPM